MNSDFWIVELNNGEEHFFMRCSYPEAAQIQMNALEIAFPYDNFSIVEIKGKPPNYMRATNLLRYYNLRNILVGAAKRNPQPKMFVIQGGKE